MSGCTIPFRKRVALDLFAFKKKIDSRVHDLRYLFWECTLRCNLSCLHCGSDCLQDASLPDMPLTDLLRIIDSIKNNVDPHKTTVAITGGEPLLREDLVECGKELYKREFPWGIVTNGYAMNRDRYERLLDAGLRSLTVSLDGMQSSHDWLRNKAGSFERAVKTIELAAAARGVVFDVATCATKRNFGELSKIKELLNDKGVRRWRIFTVFPKGRAAKNPELQLSDRQFVDLMDFIVDSKKQPGVRPNYGCEGFLGAYEGRARDNYFQCVAGVSVGSVLIDGSISACPSLRGDYIQGSIYKDDFLDVWNNRFGVMRNRSWTKTGLCATCDAYRWCQGNGLHLRKEKTGELLVCHWDRIRKGCAPAKTPTTP